MMRRRPVQLVVATTVGKGRKKAKGAFAGDLEARGLHEFPICGSSGAGVLLLTALVLSSLGWWYRATGKKTGQGDVPFSHSCHLPLFVSHARWEREKEREREGGGDKETERERERQGERERERRREREREREKETERQRQRERQGDRERHRERETRRQRETRRERERERDKETEREET